MSPSSAWDGSAGSGFTTEPTDPVRITAKPMLVMMVPPDQHFTDELVVGAMCLANANSTLVGGVDRVRFYLEGETLDVVSPSFQTFTRYDGSTYLCWGYWVRLKKATQIGTAQLYAEAIPADATMQNRVLGPYLFHLTDTLHDHSVTVGADGDYATIPAAISAMKALNAQNPLITLLDSGDYMLNDSSGGSYTSHTGYFTFEAADGADAVCKRSGDNDRVWRPSLGRAWFKNVRFDYDTIERLFAEGTFSWVMERCEIFTAQAQSLWFRNTRNAGETVSAAPYFLETRFFGLPNVCNEAHLIRGCQAAGGFADFAGRIRPNGGAFYNQVDDWRVPADALEDIGRLRIEYSGSGSSVTISRDQLGGGANRYREFLVKVDGTTEITFEAWLRADKRFDLSRGYYVTDFADAINAHPDFTATVLGDGPDPFDRIGNAMIAGKLNIGPENNDFDFTDHPIGTDFTMNGNFEFHADFIQGNDTNVIAAYNQVTNADVQGFIAVNGVDRAYVGNVISTGLENRLSPTSQFDDKNADKAYSHVLVAHNSWQGQRVTLAAGCQWDAYSLISNNAAYQINDQSGIAPGSANIVAETGTTHVEGTLGRIQVGDGSGSTFNWYTDVVAKDFTPAGDLLDNRRTPVMAYGLHGAVLPNPGAAGAISSDNVPDIDGVGVPPSTPSTVEFSYAQVGPLLTGNVGEHVPISGRTSLSASQSTRLQSIFVLEITGTEADLLAYQNSGTRVPATMLEVSLDSGASWTQAPIVDGRYQLFTGLSDEQRMVLVRVRAPYGTSANIPQTGTVVRVTGVTPALTAFRDFVSAGDGDPFVESGNALVPNTRTGFFPPDKISDTDNCGSIAIRGNYSEIVMVSKSRYFYLSEEGGAPTRYDVGAGGGTNDMRVVKITGLSGVKRYNAWGGASSENFSVGGKIAGSRSDPGIAGTLDQYGDSITQGNSTGISKGEPELFHVASALGRVGTNFGIGGDTTAKLLARVPSILAEKTVTSSDVAIIAIGRNDSPGNPMDAQNVTDYETIVTALLNAGYGRVICRGVLENETNDFSPYNADIQSIVTGYADARVVFCDVSGWTDVTYVDGTHPDSAGYATMATYAISDYPALIGNL
ncbi:MAG: SGNH/GDSL hydrolase family protein [Pseudomonadota bacterium]